MKRAVIFFIYLSFIPLAVHTDWPEYRGGQDLHGKTSVAIPSNAGLAWAYQTGAEIKAAPVIKDGRIIIGSNDGNVYCLDLFGTLLWKFETEYAVEAPALIKKNTVYVGNLGGFFYAIDLLSGEKKWKHEASNQIMAAANYWKDGESLYILIGAYDFYLYCLEANTGRIVWKYEALDYINSVVSISGNKAVFGGCDGHLHVVDLTSGKAAQKTEVASYIAGSAVLESNLAFVGDYDGKFWSIDFIEGEINWSFERESRELPYIASPAIIGSMVIAANRDRFVYCLDKSNGRLLWQRNTGSRVDASPVTDGKNALVANMRGDLLLLDVNDGSIVWTYELGSGITGNPAVTDNMIVVGTMDGSVYGLVEE